MGKIDDMRKQREEQYAERLKRAKTPAPKQGFSLSEDLPTPRAKAPALPTGDARKKPTVGEGRCSVCGKLRAVKDGLVIAHQKGLGTACPGSRKAPE